MPCGPGRYVLVGGFRSSQAAGFLLAELELRLPPLVCARLVEFPFSPIDQKFFVLASPLKTTECRCSYVSHRQGALLALLPL